LIFISGCAHALAVGRVKNYHTAAFRDACFFKGADIKFDQVIYSGRLRIFSRGEYRLFVYVCGDNFCRQFFSALFLAFLRKPCQRSSGKPLINMNP
jgi:hypothetical protein